MGNLLKGKEEATRTLWKLQGMAKVARLLLMKRERR